MPIATNPETGETVYLNAEGQWAPAPTAVNPETKQSLVFDGKDWTPVAAKSKGALGYVDDAVRSLAQGATFGFADELAAAGNTLPLVGTGKSYKENLASEATRNEQIPGAIKYPGEIAGAVAGTVAAGPATGAMSAVTRLAKLPSFVRATLAGGAGGAAFGAGEAEPGLENRVAGSAQGALLGTGLGAAAYPVAQGVAAIYRAFRPRGQAAAELGRALRRDEMTPADLASEATRLAGVRPGVATLADAGGENVRGLVERIAQTPGAGRTQVIPALTDRQRFQAGRLSVDLEGLTGSRRTAVEAVEQTMADRMALARPLYQDAMDFNAREVPEIVDAFRNATASGFGADVLRSKAFGNVLETDYGISDPMQAPLMAVIDVWKKAVDDLGGSLARTGHNNAARVVGDMRNRVVSVVDQHNPAYKAARDAWAGPTQYLEALEHGRGILKQSADDVRQTIAGLSPSEREAYVTGALAGIFKKMGDDGARMPDLTKYLRSPQAREKIAALMPTPEAAQQWAQRLDFEVQLSELTSRSLGNSRTAVRQAEQNASHEIAADLMMNAFMGSPPAHLMRHFITRLPTAVRDTVRSRSDRALADILLNPDAIGSAHLADTLARAHSQAAPPSALRGAIPANAASSTLEP